MPLVLKDEGNTVFTAAIILDDKAIDAWDLRTQKKLILSPFLNFGRSYNNMLREMPGERIILCDDRESVILAVFCNSNIVGAVNVCCDDDTFRIINISTTGIVPRGALLILGAAQQYVERNQDKYKPHVTPIEPYFPMECILKLCGDVLFSCNDIYGKCDETSVVEYWNKPQFPGISLDQTIIWEPIPYKRTDIIKNKLRDKIDEFVAANTPL